MTAQELFSKVSYFITQSEINLGGVIGTRTRNVMYLCVGQIFSDTILPSGQVIKKCDRQTFDEASRLIVEKFGKIYVAAEIKKMKLLHEYFVKEDPMLDAFTWEQLRLIVKIKHKLERDWYMYLAIKDKWNVEALDYAIKNNYIELFLMDKTVKAEDRLAYSLKCVMIHNEIKKLLGKENEIKVKLDMI